MQFTLQKANAKITSLNPRAEKHGEDNVRSEPTRSAATSPARSGACASPCAITSTRSTWCTWALSNQRKQHDHAPR